MGNQLPEGTEEFDFIVIGQTSSGIAAARRALALGKNVCLIDNIEANGKSSNNID